RSVGSTGYYVVIGDLWRGPALYAILPTVTLIIVRSKRSVEDSLQPSEMSSVCQQCSSVVSISGTRTRTRGEAVRLTMLPGNPNDQSKSRFGKEPTGPITVMMEQETEVSRASPNSTLVAARLGGTPDPSFCLTAGKYRLLTLALLPCFHTVIFVADWVETVRILLDGWFGVFIPTEGYLGVLLVRFPSEHCSRTGKQMWLADRWIDIPLKLRSEAPGCTSSWVIHTADCPVDAIAISCVPRQRNAWTISARKALPTDLYSTAVGKKPAWAAWWRGSTVSNALAAWELLVMGKQRDLQVTN
ncbi:hypothetical protein B0H13DRAFT_1916944, partial [Mycena leptocephala]